MLKLKKKKYEFYVDQTKFLGYIISKDGLKMDKNKD